MRVLDIWQELTEVTGVCDEEVNFRALTRAIELLANRGLFDPLIGTIDFNLSGGYLLALPRDVKTPIRLNINNNPSFARNRIYEFSPNGEGTNDGAEVGWQWHERGYSAVQDEIKLPSVLTYIVAAGDVGKTLTVRGTDPNGWERVETIVGAVSGAVATINIYSEIKQVTRQATTTEAYLWAATGPIARYYPDEEQPEYRVIKLSQTGVAVRMLYRKHVFKITSQQDVIPLQSAMAVIRAVDSVRLMQKKRYEEAALVFEEAVKMVVAEQSTRDEGSAVSEGLEIQSAINAGISGELMIAADIYDDASEIFGPVGRAKLLDRITDAVQLLSNKSHWDSMVATVTLAVGASGMLSLPRFVHTPLAININNNPAFVRSRLFEYSINTNGSETGEQLGYSWALNEESPLSIDPSAPTVLTLTGDAGDSSKTLKFTGLSSTGVEITEEIAVGSVGAVVFQSVSHVAKDVTTKLVSVKQGATVLAIYYPDETQPIYRRVRISKPSSSVKVLFRKRTPKISSLFDPIPLRSREAVKGAMRAIKAFAEGNAKLGEEFEKIAVRLLTEENDSKLTALGDASLTPTDININTNDVLIVGDIYDMASEIFGPIGRRKIFDRITDAINILSHKSQWDSLLGVVDVMRVVNCDEIVPASRRCRSHGYFVLPRYVGAALGVNTSGYPGIPRNRWFEFHLNGTGETNFASCGTWDDAGDVVIINRLPKGECCAIEPTKLVAIPSDVLDEGKTIRIYGVERLEDGKEVEVWRDGIQGWTCPCTLDSYTAGIGDPAFVKIDRITREETVGFVSLFGLEEASPSDEDLLLGYWYPDEIEPRYRMIKIAGCCSKRIRVKYRKRTNKVTSMNDVLNLRSRPAVENIMRSLAILPTDPSAAVSFEAIAVNYLSEEQTANNPIMAGGLQFDPGTAPGHNENVQ